MRTYKDMQAFQMRKSRMQDVMACTCIHARALNVGRVSQVSGVLVTAVFTVALGFTTTVEFALASRALIGLFNANFAIGKAAISGSGLVAHALAAALLPTPWLRPRGTTTQTQIYIMLRLEPSSLL